MSNGSVCFGLSNVGELCEKPISDVTLCKMVAESKVIERSSFENLTGDGNDLPYGCILDTLPVHSSHDLQMIYWNPKGVAISKDGYIRQICFSRKLGVTV